MSGVIDLNLSYHHQHLPYHHTASIIQELGNLVNTIKQQPTDLRNPVIGEPDQLNCGYTLQKLSETFSFPHNVFFHRQAYGRNMHTDYNNILRCLLGYEPQPLDRMEGDKIVSSCYT